MFHIIVLIITFCVLHTFGSSDKYPNSCKKLKDGEHQLKFLDGDDYPVVNVKCSNGYAILDYNFDNNIKEYFSSWDRWHTKVYGPSNTEHINWREWFLPDGNGDTEWNYKLSYDCNTCDGKDSSYGVETNPAWFMTGTIFGCFWTNKGQPNCDVDFDDYTCYSCYDQYSMDTASSALLSTNTEYMSRMQTGVCPVNVMRADSDIVSDHYSCATYQNHIASQNHLKPSIGGFGSYCECVKASESVKYYKGEYTIDESSGTDSDFEYKYVEIYQKDFSDGTYRITQPGTYTIMEDISFDFNSGDATDPHDYDTWWPKSEQVDSYPGAGNFKDAYFMGFFAGITIEADDVVLDLNNFKIEQSIHFYHLQRWFTSIEIGTQYFLPGQGFGNFGGDIATPSNIVIKNGIIGLTSHHGIHGNNNKNIILENLIIKEFETHGIQLSGFNNLEMNNIEIGPISDKVYFSGEYAHMRALMPRFQKVAEETDEEVFFYGRDEGVTMQDIVDEIEIKMNMVWNHVVFGTEYDEKNEIWQDAKKLFYNEGGYPYGGAMYGIFLNTFGASVFTYNLYAKVYSKNVKINNLKIHDLVHEMKEYVSFRQAGSFDLYINPITAPLSALDIFDDPTNPVYTGTIITDAYFAMENLTNNWNYLGSQVVGKNQLLDWVLTNNQDGIGLNDDNEVQLGCNMDVMIHSGKGIHGLRIDGVKNAYIENIYVYNLKDTTPLGINTCGEYGEMSLDDLSGGTSIGHFRQTSPMQVGFTGNHVQGIQINSAKQIYFKNVDIYNLESYHGAVMGMSIWPANEISLEGNINVYDLHAGVNLPKGVLTYDSRPNLAPEACGILIYYSYYSSEYDYTFDTSVSVVSDTNINSYNINGHVGCKGDDTVPTMIGYGTTLNDKSDLTDNNKILYNFEDVDDDDDDDTTDTTNEDISEDIIEDINIVKSQSKHKRKSKKSSKAHFAAGYKIGGIVMIATVFLLSVFLLHRKYGSKLVNDYRPLESFESVLH